MLYRNALRHSRLIIAAVLGAAHPVVAQDDTVRVSCDALTPDDAAQVEARVRATLLTAVDAKLSVRVDCAQGSASIRVVAGERTESLELALPAEKPHEALIAAVESLLETLEQTNAGEPADSSPRQAVASSAPPPARPAPAPSVPAESPSPATRAPPDSEAAHWDVGAGALAELWQGAIGYGARLVVERRRAPWSLGGALGWLTTPELTELFRTHELHALAFGAFEEGRYTGLRASLGAGASMLVIRPDAELVVQTPTTLALPFLNAELSRPVRFGHAWVFPAVALRIFPGRREVTVDAERRLVLPPFCPALFLGLGYEL
ncbi:MAG TPA: hypothetical protein VGQ57_03365 [Polyangiaceae bacterium]|nr:hypothetical protein [Polyangiaceae bacterium]